MAKLYLKLIKACLERDYELRVVCAEEGDYLAKGGGYKEIKDAVECVEMVNLVVHDPAAGENVAVYAIIPAYAEEGEDIVDYGGKKAEGLLLLAGGIGFTNADGEVVYVR